MASKKYHRDHYQNNKWLYLHKSKIQRNSIKDFDFETCFDYYLWTNRQLKHPERSRKKITKIKIP